ncbi:cyclin-like protein [Gymnopilus junonius]|uniref:Cyclin-like protein n=1 Tax=Gymnopilus junonius TaxID=109634 RepID=A0A9P5NUH8_GYMJU|nr:cyclin-like protein [Gymnopilus junonius]
MATDYWASSHFKRWIVDRAALNQARLEDLQCVDDPDYLDYLSIYFAQLITKLGKKLHCRQRTIATAIVFFRRFYLKNSYCETDPFIVVAACCYLAAKAEESPIHIKLIVTESRSLFNQEIYSSRGFSADNAKIAEMEFYLVDDLECDLVVFHPYRTLLTLCRQESTGETPSEEGEALEFGVGIGSDDGPRYWGTGRRPTRVGAFCLENCMVVMPPLPPHLIAIAAIYLTFIIHPPTPSDNESAGETPSEHSPPTTRQPRRSSRQVASAQAASQKKPPQDTVGFLSELNVSLPVVATIVQEIISLYTLWDRYKEDGTPESSRARDLAANSPGTNSNRASASAAATPGMEDSVTVDADGNYITPAFLSSVLQKMREARIMDLAPTRPAIAINKRLERTQAAG